MNNHTEQQKNWNDLYYGFLAGAKIVSVENNIDDYDDVWTKLVVEKDGQKFEVEISCDEEGNRPGFLFGLPSVVVKDDELVRLDGSEDR